MASRHELEIEITAAGKVEVTVKGAKGRGCLEYVQVFNAIGKVEDQKPTGEFYDPEPTVYITDQTRTRTRF